MTIDESYKSQWLAALEETAARFRLVFLQLGAAQRPVRQMLQESMESSFRIVDYVASSRSQFPKKLILLTDLESVVGSVAQGLTLNALRERVFADMDAGFNFVLLSTSPRVSYPSVPGSSLLEDARFIHGPLLPAELLESDPANVLPDCFENQTELRGVLLEALQELGVEVCASIDHAMFEVMLNPDDVFATLSSREIEALEGASLAVVEDGKPRWSVTNRSGELKDALSDVLADHTEPQASVTDVFNALWALERSIRQAVRARAKELWGHNWRQDILVGDLPDRVLERATVAAYAAAKSIKEVRDPLEWLSLGELLETRTNRPEIGDLGVEPAIWKIFANEVLPIRNRLSHMRLMKPADPPIVRRWLRVMERKLKS